MKIVVKSVEVVALTNGQPESHVAKVKFGPVAGLHDPTPYYVGESSDEIEAIFSAISKLLESVRVMPGTLCLKRSDCNKRRVSRTERNFFATVTIDGKRYEAMHQSRRRAIVNAIGMAYRARGIELLFEECPSAESATHSVAPV